MRKLIYMLLISTLLLSGCNTIQSDNQKNVKDEEKTSSTEIVAHSNTNDSNNTKDGETSRKKEVKLIKDWEINKIVEDFRPTVENNDIYALSTQFCYIDSHSGKIKWSSPLLGNLVDEIYLNTDSLAIVGGNKMNYFDRKTGKLLWDFNTQKEIFSAPVEKDGIIYFTASEGILYAIDLISGKEKWNFKPNSGLPTMAYLSNPVIVDNKVLFSSGLDKTVYAVDIVTHKAKWKFNKLNTDSANMFSDGRNAYLVNGDGSIYAFDVINATKRWSKSLNTSINTYCTIRNGRIYIYSQDKHIFCINLENGNLEFDYIFGGKHGIGDICVTDDMIYFTTYEDLASIDLNGKNFKLFELDSCLAKKVVSNANELFITTTDNKLIKYLISD